MRVDASNSIRDRIEIASNHVFYLTGRLTCECGKDMSYTVLDSWDNKPVMYLCEDCAREYQRQNTLV